jgi:hypothetical protein
MEQIDISFNPNLCNSPKSFQNNVGAFNINDFAYVVPEVLIFYVTMSENGSSNK